MFALYRKMPEDICDAVVVFGGANNLISNLFVYAVYACSFSGRLCVCEIDVDVQYYICCTKYMYSELLVVRTRINLMMPATLVCGVAQTYILQYTNSSLVKYI